MSDSKLFAGGLFAAGLAFIAGFFLLTNGSHSPAAAAEDTAGPNLVIEVGGATEGRIVIDLLADVAPQHAERLAALADSGAYDGVVFHRVIDGFMAQTGDVQFGKAGGDTSRAGMGGSEMADLPAEFSDVSFERGVVGMARSQNPNSANSQFFIMFAPAPHLNGQYTVVGRVIEGMDVVDAIKKGNAAANGSVADPDRMVSVSVER
ncbi:peptidylprolyl isomerase [Tropicimonas sediminicola]|uniref:Peptidyl-prolyl cis-trans isomerase n=1 Tax=Tropicimonas sediminicola TaxID=1031541 RepID=A0A239ECC2_9RHOB|nr:peptidylprolyl isomerase [Tropicimonas sediminicola]SNS42325.1 peptidylprolyl isomerase [Tropicimonas sediminicola]